MDPLALLTRSAKRPKSRPQNTQKIPSRGPTSNPQLYPSSSPGLKCKRDSEDEDDSSSDGETGLDFFGKGTTKPKKQKSQEKKTAGYASAVSGSEPAHGSTQRMSLEDRRRLYKQHKLKCSILEPSESASLVESKKKKKSKRKSEEAETKSKPTKGANQIFPEPIEHFHQLRSRFKISDTLANNIHEQGFKLPTEVQMVTLPLLMGGAAELEDSDALIDGNSQDRLNLLTVAPTGSGKTLAFLIPLLHSIHRTIGKQAPEGPLAVILAPTKELVNQIVNEGRKLAVDFDINIVAARKDLHLGSTSSNEEVATTPHIIVGTPLGLLHALEQSESDKDGADTQTRPLPSVQHLVLDEADVLLDPLFKTQTIDAWKALNNKLLTISLWSATISSTIETEIQKITSERHQGHTHPPTPLVRLIVGLKDSAVPNISHKLTYCATETGKLMALRELLSPKSAGSSPSDVPLRAPFLVFTQTIPRASALHSELKFDIPISAGGSSRIAVLHSELPDRVRDKILTNFRKGEIWILITTDLLARGVDFKGVNGVVNYDIPTSAASYVHRVGRTGRAGRDGGVAVTLFTKEDIKWVKIVANIIAATGQNSGKEVIAGGVDQWLLDALPDVSKQDRKKLKTRGVQGRRKDEKTSRIGTKSGYVRREENKRRGPRRGSH